MLKDYEHILPLKVRGVAIPKIIHQTHRSWEALTPELLENITRLKRQNPNWEYRFYDDVAIEAYVLEHYGEEVLSYYRRIDVRYGAARADFFRYLLMYNDGGVYLDIKSSFSCPIDEYLRSDDTFLLCHWDNLEGQPHAGFGLFGGYDYFPKRGEYQQFHIESVAGHELLRAVLLSVLKNIDDYSPYRHNVGRWGVFHVTGPVAYSQAIERYLETHQDVDYRLIDNALEEDVKLIYNVFSGLPLGGHRQKLGSTYRQNRMSVVLPKNAWQWCSFGAYTAVRTVAARLRTWVLSLKA